MNFTDGGYYFIRFPGQIRAINPADYTYRDYGHSQADAPCPGPPISGLTDRGVILYQAMCIVRSMGSDGLDALRLLVGEMWVVLLTPMDTGFRTPQPGDVAISTNGYWGACNVCGKC